MLLGPLSAEWGKLPGLTARELATLLPLVVLIILLGILPGPLVGLIKASLHTWPLAALAKGG